MPVQCLLDVMQEKELMAEDPKQHEKEGQPGKGAATGAVGGAVTGAAVGAAVGGPVGVIVGGAIGAAAGHEVGKAVSGDKDKK